MRTGTLVAVSLALAAVVASPAWSEAPPRFRLDILMADWRDLGQIQDWESAWPRLQEASGDVFFSIGERDVAAYDWQAQRIVLRPEVSQRLLAADLQRAERHHGLDPVGLPRQHRLQFPLRQQQRLRRIDRQQRFRVVLAIARLVRRQRDGLAVLDPRLLVAAEQAQGGRQAVAAGGMR